MSYRYRNPCLPEGAGATVADVSMPDSARTLAHGLRQCRPDPRRLDYAQFAPLLDTWRDAVESVATSIAADSDDLGDDFRTAFKYACNW